MNQRPPSPSLSADLGPSSLRIAVISETYPPEVNGVAMTMERLVTDLRKRGHHIQLIRPRQGTEDQAQSDEGLEEYILPGLGIPGYDGLKMGLPAGGALSRLWKRQRPHLVHVATEGPLGWSAINIAARLKLPATSDFHTNFHSYTRHYGVGLLKRPIAAYLRHFHNRARCTMVPTASLRRELEQEGYRNVLVVARGVDGKLFNPSRRRTELRAQWGATDKDLVAIYVGRLAPEKGLDTVIAAHAAIAERQPGAKLVFVGDGPERRRLEAAHPEHVFAGMRTGADLAEHYASADLFLFASTTETYGNVTMEAMASGLPVIAYDYAAAQEHIRHGVNGLLAPFADRPAFVERAREMAAAPERIPAMGQAARQSAEAVDWQEIYDSFAHILATTAGNGNAYSPTGRLSYSQDQA